MNNKFEQATVELLVNVHINKWYRRCGHMLMTPDTETKIIIEGNAYLRSLDMSDIYTVTLESGREERTYKVRVVRQA